MSCLCSPLSLWKFVLSWSRVSPGLAVNQCHLKYVNFETHLNHISHETMGLSRKHLVVRRGKPFRLTLMFDGCSWNPQTDILGVRIWLGTKYYASPVTTQTRLQEWHALTPRLQTFLLKATTTLLAVSCAQQLSNNQQRGRWYQGPDSSSLDSLCLVIRVSPSGECVCVKKCIQSLRS